MIVGTISKNIKRFRENRDYTQEYIASKMGISQSAYRKFESGETEISLSKLEKIAEVLDIPLTEFLVSDDKFIYNNFNNYNKGTINNQPDITTELYDKIIIEKDKLIASKDIIILAKDAQINSLQRIIDKFLPIENPKKK